MSYYTPQQDEQPIEDAHIEPEHELNFDDDFTPVGDAYRFTDTLTLIDKS